MSEDATNPVVEAEITAPETGVADEANAQGDELNLDTGTGETDNPGGEDGEGDGEPAVPEDHEEIEHDGQKYLVPKTLKEAFLRQADYTQKTQATAEQRRQLEAREQAWEQERAQQAETITQLRAEVGKVATLESQMAAYQDVDWRGVQAQIAAMTDPTARAAAITEYNLAWSQFTALERELGQAKQSLSAKEQELTQAQTQRVQATMRETLQTLQKDIPGFGQDLANKIVDHGMKAFGLQPEEARQLADPRIWKLLNSDFAKSSEIEKLKAENAKLKGQRTAQTNNERAQVVRPAVAVKGAAPNTGLTDGLSDDEWISRRNAQVAKR